FEKAAGIRLLRETLKKTNKAVIITTPKFETGQADLCGNELERHRSLWSAQDFSTFDRATVKTIDRATLLAVLLKPGVPVRAGARYIAFTWPAFWWTGHYRKFYRHLCEKFSRVLKDDRLLVFDLQN